MTHNSFYDLDYIIDLNEKRLSTYYAAYQKNLDKFTNLLVIFSALSIFLVPIIKDFIDESKQHWAYWICFIFFSILFITSIIYTIRLLIPVEVAYLVEPKRYYEEYRINYEEKTKVKDEVDKLVKASYINELEQAVTNNNNLFKRKGFFYYKAFMFGILAVLPYLICLSFHFSKKDENIQKVEIINIPKNLNFDKIPNMSDSSNNNSNADTGSNQANTTSSTTTTTTTQLPGVNVSDVIPSSPQMIKENFNDTTTKSGNSGNKKD